LFACQTKHGRLARAGGPAGRPKEVFSGDCGAKQILFVSRCLCLASALGAFRLDRLVDAVDAQGDELVDREILHAARFQARNEFRRDAVDAHGD
jgi:hypothetical protein